MVEEKKILENEGILESVHPSIFVVRLKRHPKESDIYSYSDVLTKTVQLDFVG